MARSRTGLLALALLAAAAALLVAPGADANALLGTSRAESFLMGRRLLQNNNNNVCSLNCETIKNCISVTCVSATNSLLTVTVDYRPCKTGGTFSWVCCRGSLGAACSITTCAGGQLTNPSTGDKCETAGITTMTFPITDGVIPSTITIPQAPFAPGCIKGVCPPTSNFTKAGIPNVDTCTSCTQKACFEEKSVGEWGTWYKNWDLIRNTYECIAKPFGPLVSVESPSTGETIQVPTYRPMIATTYPYMASFFNATPAVGTGIAIECFTDETYTVTANYLYIMRASSPPETNYACPTCKYYQVSSVSACRCSNDTAWAVPVLAARNAASFKWNVSTEQKLDSASYPYGDVFWTGRAEAGNNAWGGWFRITPAPHTDLTQTYTFDVCAGCAQNDPKKGFIAGRVTFKITANNGLTSVSTFLTPTGAPNAKVASQVLHMYQSWIQPPLMNPGQFKAFTELYTTGGAVLPPITLTNTLKLNDQWVSKVVPNFVKTGGTNYTIGADEVQGSGTNTKAGLFVAIHLTIATQYCPS
ncbi:hypothetical protein HYH02_010642 [Chlamydomonas schloesseri]|uniref:Uncharacterized protein n=1 Tax=Chlamydomonas schloesseri TaxID=2026947 RepID=A0A835W560_9CHLO|nr:hypothetical protein HYH02_010642 [Chlamydomonas schloesseri]|eukprot:KAG2439765.1 hypothetical protein HYH02_010642 [Chlamydomonas schloesseri]